MSLFAGTGFFTQSAVLFPTSIEKNKKTEACSRDPQASSLLHGKGRHWRPFFTRGGRQTLSGGAQAGLGMAKSLHRPAPAMQICWEQSAPDEGLICPGGGRAQGRMPGQCSEGGTPPRLDPKTNPKLASVAWESGGWSLSLPAACTGGSRTTWRGGAGGMILQQPPISPLHRASCWAGTYSDPQF